MIDEICDDIVSLYDGLRAGVGPMRDFKAVHKGNTPPDSAFHPSATFDWDGKASMVLDGNKAVTKFRFAAVAFSSSMAGMKVGAAEHRNLLCRLADDGRIIGLLPATMHLLSGYNLSTGLDFLVKPEGELKSYVIRKGNHASFASILYLNFETWLNPSQVLT